MWTFAEDQNMTRLLGYGMPLAMLLWIPAMAQEAARGDPFTEYVFMAVYFVIVFPVVCLVWHHTWKYSDARRPRKPLTQNQVWWVWITGLVVWAFIAPLLGMLLGLGAPQLGE